MCSHYLVEVQDMNNIDDYEEFTFPSKELATQFAQFINNNQWFFTQRAIGITDLSEY